MTKSIDETTDYIVDAVILPACTRALSLLKDDRNPPSWVYKYAAEMVTPKVKSLIAQAEKEARETWYEKGRTDENLKLKTGKDINRLTELRGEDE